MAWRITYSETRVYRVPQQRGPGPFKRLLWAILGLAAGGAVMWFLVRGGEWDRLKHDPLAALEQATRGLSGERQRSQEAPPEEFTERGPDRELAYAEAAEGIYPVAHGASVYAAPDTRGEILDDIHVGKRVRVTGSTPDFLRITDEAGAVGYIPFDAVRVMNPEEQTYLCYGVKSDASLLKFPNAHSDVVGNVGQGTDMPALGMGLHHYPFVRNVRGIEGYVSADDVLEHERCPDY
jgi:hypothetical protein